MTTAAGHRFRVSAIENAVYRRILVAALLTEMVKNVPAMRETKFDPWVGKIPWRRKWQPPPVFFPGESHGQGSLGGYRHGVAKSQTQLSD